MNTFPHEVFILFLISSQLGCYSLKTEQNKVKVIGCGERYSSIYQDKKAKFKQEKLEMM